MGAFVDITAADGHQLAAYLATPPGKPRGALVVVQTAFGVDDYLRGVCDAYAGEGYAAIAPALYAKPMIAVSDFAGIALLGNVTLILVARPDLPATGVRELIAMLRAKPGGYSFGSPGIGSAHHLLAELVMSREQVKALHVPYPGSVKAVADLMEGRFDFMFVDGTVALPQIAAGKLKPLAVTGPGRWPVQANIPALATS